MAYANSDYSFSQPVRYYKANDPYYYEVDNIPVRQLEENVLWVKDQVDSLLAIPEPEAPAGVPLYVGDDIDLEHIKQFRPKAIGARNISIQPGKFTARINDAYDVDDSLAQITLAAVTTIVGAQGDTLTCNELPRFQQAQSVAFFDAVWASYTEKLTDAQFASCPGESNKALAYRATGLETMYTFYLSNDFGLDLTTNQYRGEPIPTAGTTPNGAPEYAPAADGTNRAQTWPAIWHGDIYNLLGPVFTTNWNMMNQLHLKVVQHWRGVVRTSVVDFRGDTIEIPTLHQYDYYYLDEGDNPISLYDLVTQRIDLLVVYSHPVDTSSTTLAEYDDVATVTVAGGASVRPPKTITTPRIGLVRGAGVGIKRVNDGRIDTDDKRVAPGGQKILANLNDHLDGRSNSGFKLSNGDIVHGSFPSPDDLTNIAPNLTLSLADKSLQLVGQTAIPIAYVVVSKNSVSITQDNIIDIRPFLRTTELAYNERAGVAAAQPPLSFANPAVGSVQMENQADCLRAYTEQSVSNIPPYYSNAYSNSYSEDDFTNSVFTLGQTIFAKGYGAVELVTDGYLTRRGSNFTWARGLEIPLENIEVGGLTSSQILSKYSIVAECHFQGGASDDGQYEGDMTLGKPAWRSSVGDVGLATGEGKFYVLIDVLPVRIHWMRVGVVCTFMSKGGFNPLPLTTVL